MAIWPLFTIGYDGSLKDGETATVDVAHVLSQTTAADYSVDVVSAITEAADMSPGVLFDGTTLTFAGPNAVISDQSTAFAGAASQDASGDATWILPNNIPGDTPSTPKLVRCQQRRRHEQSVPDGI